MAKYYQHSRAEVQRSNTSYVLIWEFRSGKWTAHYGGDRPAHTRDDLDNAFVPADMVYKEVSAEEARAFIKEDASHE